MPMIRLKDYMSRALSYGYALLLVISALTLPSAASAQDKARGTTPDGVANSGPTRVFMFDMKPGGTYAVSKNGTDLLNATANPFGAMAFNDVVVAGDVFQIIWTGDDPVTPLDRTLFTADGTDLGCVDLTWNTEDPTEYIYEYLLVWGPEGGAFTDSAMIDVADVTTAGGISSYSHCGLPTNRFCFAIKAHNLFNLWSGFSPTACADITNGSTQGPTPPANVTVTESDFGCARVTWSQSSDPTVTGYTVYYGDQSVAGGQASVYDDSVTVGAVATRQICGFSAGMYYFAVKAVTGSGLKSVYSAERNIQLSGTDDQPPVISDRNPANNATGVPLNAILFFTVSDAWAGVDQSSLTVTVNGIEQPQPAFVGTPNAYVVVVTMSELLPANSTVNVGVVVSDLAPTPNELTASWSFETDDTTAEDNDPPVITATEPASGAKDKEPNTSVTVRIQDAGFGVLAEAIEFYVNGELVSHDEPVGDIHDMLVTYDPEEGFQPGSTVNIRIAVSDIAGNPENLEYAFTIKPQYLVDGSGQNAKIVPDGFWADDPTRPLVVLNVPLTWTVRIFDTAGRLVKSFKNDERDGVDWTWDFTNNRERHVARALYLVRVTDRGGTVVRSGRFLVQSDQ